MRPFFTMPQGLIFAKMNARRTNRDRSWFRTNGGHRYGIELGLVVVAKLLALTILYLVFIAPQPHADASSAAVQRHLLGMPSANKPVTP